MDKARGAQYQLQLAEATRHLLKALKAEAAAAARREVDPQQLRRARRALEICVRRYVKALRSYVEFFMSVAEE